MKKIMTGLLVVLVFIFASCVPSDAKEGVVENIKDYDKEAEEYSIIFKDVDDVMLDFKVLKYNQKITIPTLNEKSSPRYEYEFIGWDYNSDNEVDSIPEYATFSFVAKAVYQLTYKNYRVTFRPDCDSFEGDDLQYIDFGSAATAPTNLVKKGYTFDGWDSSFDYITGEKTINAKWSLNQYKICFNVDKDQYLIERDENFHIVTTRNFFRRLPIPKYIRSDLYFVGWEYNGKQITNFTGDLFEPLVIDSDIMLNPIFESYTVNDTYEMGYLRIKQIVDTDLISKLEEVITTNNIETPFFYEEKIYEKVGDIFYENKEIEYIYMGRTYLSAVMVGAFPNFGLFISKEVLFYDYASNKDNILLEMKSNDKTYSDSIYSLPYDYVRFTNVSSEDIIMSILKDRETDAYFPKYYSSIVASDHLNLPNIDSYLICNDREDQTLKLLNNQGNNLAVESTEKYGYRICLQKIIGRAGTFEMDIII